jgi:hypothetical protein
MTNNEAKRSLLSISYGTLATLTGLNKYDELDDLLAEKLDAIDHMDVSDCNCWQDVWNKLNLPVQTPMAPMDFVYKGMSFHPIKTLKGKQSDFFFISKRIADIKITPSGWNYQEFYAIAEKNGAGNIDLFETNGKVVIPAMNYLFEYRLNEH